MKSNHKSKFDRTEVVLWFLFAIVFLAIAGCIWVVVNHRLTGTFGMLD